MVKQKCSVNIYCIQWQFFHISCFIPITRKVGRMISFCANYVKIKELAEMTGMNQQYLSRAVKAGKLVPAHQLESNKQGYTIDLDDPKNREYFVGRLDFDNLPKISPTRTRKQNNTCCNLTKEQCYNLRLSLELIQKFNQEALNILANTQA